MSEFRVPFRNFAELQRGFDLPTGLRLDGVVPVIASNGIVGCHNEAKVSAPGVVTGRSGTIGVVIRADVDFWPLNTTLFVKDFKGNDPGFVALTLEAMNLAAHAGGSTVPSLNRNVLDEVTVYRPPLLVQRRIVDLMGHLDTHLANLQTEHDALMTLMDQLCIAAEAESRFSVLGDLLERIDAGKSPSGEDRIPGPGERAVLKVSAVSLQGFDASQVKTVGAAVELPAGLSVQRGDVLMVRANGVLKRVGQVCQVEADYSQLFLCDKTLRLVCGPNLDPTYLSFVLRTPQARSRIEGLTTGSDMRNISQRAIRHLEIPAPPIARQRALATQLDSIRSLTKEVRQEREALGSLRKSLLTCLLSRDRELPEAYDDLLGVG